MPQLVQLLPPEPHAFEAVPVLQVLPEQQPGQEEVLQTQLPLTQVRPDPHEPVWQVPPHPSDAPQVEQLGNGHQLSAAYPYAHTQHLNDVVGGSNVSAWDCGGDYVCTAKKGYDGPTGLGTPDGAAAC